MNTEGALRALAALAHENRLGVFRLLVEQGPAGIAAGRIAERLKLPAPTTSFHLKELVQAGLASARRDSRFIYYSANYATMNGLIEYMTHNCCRPGDASASECVPCAPQKPAPRTQPRAGSTSRSSTKPTKRRSA